ncbi:MAG: hypothetical protein PHV51_08165 [Methanosarcinaceae archaeon]|nr:hypothetical protein [Methanosarcinaceae archaeon]MDD4498105.1 hypothetical protein [Methanosarcinaceae archaeon]
MAKLMSDVKKGAESGKGLSIHDRLEHINEDIDSLAKKTGAEASKIAERITKEIHSVAGEIRAIDVGEEIKGITDRVEKLIEATGESAKKLAEEIKADLQKLREKL